MPARVQARLDPQSQKRLAALARAFGWTPSQIVREGLRALERSLLRKKQGEVIGLGKFDSAASDLASNKKHLQGYGRIDLH